MNKSINFKRILPLILAVIIAISGIFLFTLSGIKSANAESTEIIYVAEETQTVDEGTPTTTEEGQTNVKNFKLTDTLLYALVGFVLTICVLAFLWGFINLLKLVIEKIENIGKKPTVESTAEVKEDLPLAPGSSGQIKTHGIADKDVAMIMAIVADELKTPLNELKFISIKEIKENN